MAAPGTTAVSLARVAGRAGARETAEKVRRWGVVRKVTRILGPLFNVTASRCVFVFLGGE